MFAGSCPGPIRLALDQEIISASTTVFDYGCGRGSDLRHLTDQGITCNGWDPMHRPDGAREPADVVNLGYVINVIETADERDASLREAWKLTQGVLLVTARLRLEELGADLVRYQDGFLTSRGTFQKFYDQAELRTFIDSTLDVSCVPAAPGVFYVFRSTDDHQSFLARQYRRRLSTPKRSESDRSLQPTGPSSILFSTSRPIEAGSPVRMSSATPSPYSKPSAHPNGRSTSFAEF